MKAGNFILLKVVMINKINVHMTCSCANLLSASSNWASLYILSSGLLMPYSGNKCVCMHTARNHQSCHTLQRKVMTKVGTHICKRTLMLAQDQCVHKDTYATVVANVSWCNDTLYIGMS